MPSASNPINQSTIFRDTNQLRELCEVYSNDSTMTRVPHGQPDWDIVDGRLRHARTDYFNIGLYESPDGEPLYLFEQKRQALVMLLVAEVNGAQAALLNLRTEPGLIGLTNLTATIQSTPNNYLREHGGKATPFVEIAANPGAFGTTLYDGEQFDWGNYYVWKTKRFLVVQLNAAVEAPPGFCWVDMPIARELLHEDYLLTTDLRTILTYALAPPQNAPMPLPRPEDADTLKQLPWTTGAADAHGTEVVFLRTETKVREVSQWTQPLLVPASPLEVALAFAEGKSGKVFAIEKRTQPGLLGRQLWFPAQIEPTKLQAAKLKAGEVVQQVSTSAEGGRFWQYGVHLKLCEVKPSHDAPAPPLAGIFWMTMEEISALIAEPLSTSLELRLVWSLVQKDHWGDE